MKKKQDNIRATIAMPLYKAKEIVWLALESLCNQVTDEDWELVIAEEQFDDFAGISVFKQYEKKLKAAGMVNLVYIPVFDRISLAEKWRLIAQHSAGELFFLQAADAYSPSDWIDRASKKMDLSQCDFYHRPNRHFYNIKNGKMVLYDSEAPRTHMAQVHLTENIAKLPEKKVWRGVDNYLLSSVPGCKKKLDRSPVEGLATDGYNVISIHRHQIYNKLYLEKIKHKGIYHQPKKRLQQIVPAYVADKLEKMKEA